MPEGEGRIGNSLVLHDMPLKHERAEDDTCKQVRHQDHAPYDKHAITLFMIGFHDSCAPS